MKTYKVPVDISYYEPYIPYRCRNPRYSKKQAEIQVSVRMVTCEEAPIAFLLSDYSHKSDGQTVIRCYKRKLYKQLRMHSIVSCRGTEMELDAIPAENVVMAFRRMYGDNVETTKEDCVAFYKRQVGQFIIIDGQVWESAGEPRYVVNTFGLGHNHGGTGLFVEEFYNPNISHRNYFSALEGDEAVAYANEVATRRGDTNDVGRFKREIEVLMPECVHVKPSKQHGNGDPFINKLDSITENSSSVAEAGILACMFTAQSIMK